jgi:CheY-like chemotaxis protein
MLVFCVHDSGKGIPEDRLEMIFEPFRQVDFSDTRTHGGTGLGLTICKKLVEIMGGKMWVESSLEPGNRGSSFFFTLPYQPAEEGPVKDVQPKKRAELPPLRCQRSGMILLAEDDLTSRKLATRMLEKAGFEVLPAHDGCEAVSLFEQHQSKIDLILMDVMMPNMDGLEATQRVRQIERQSHCKEAVPIVALSAGAMKGDREKGLEMGMSDYLYKPVNRAQLLKTLAHFLGEDDGCVKQ